MKNYAFIFCLISLCTQYSLAGDEQDSIQGKDYGNRINGIYDLNISNQQIRDFINDIKTELVHRNSFVNLFNYPFKFNHDGRHEIVNNPNELIRRFEEIITPNIQRIIQESNFDSVFCNAQGFMLGNGEIWFDPTKGIVAINH